MKKNNRNLLITAICLFGIVSLFALMFKNKGPHVCGEKKQVETITKSADTITADSMDIKYNYQNKNESKYDITFLEFGSTGCKPCQMMEEVMASVKAKYPYINVVFINVSKKENRAITDYFKIEQIPTQVLLDKSGKEYFRHVGYFSFEDLKNNFNK